MLDVIIIVLLNIIFPKLLFLLGRSLKRGKAEYPEEEVLARRRTKGVICGYRTPSSIISPKAWDYAQ